MSTLSFPGQQTRGFDDVNLWFGFVAKEYSNRRVHRQEIEYPKLMSVLYEMQDGVNH